MNNFEPVIGFGLGGYTFVNAGSFRGSFDVVNTLTLRFFNNEYHYWDGSKNSIKTISGNNNDSSLSENSYFQNLLEPSVAGQWGVGNLSCRVLLALPLTFRRAGSTGMVKDGSTDGSLVKQGLDSTTTTIIVAPNLRLAVQWRIIPMLTLNAGGRITVSSFTRAVTEGKEYNQGDEISDSSIRTVAPAYGSTSNSLTAGFTLRATNNLTLEAAAGIGDDNTISVFDPDGFFTFANILLSMKF
jgi:hypothetical protein